jgi:hypothetical protein
MIDEKDLAAGQRLLEENRLFNAALAAYLQKEGYNGNRNRYADRNDGAGEHR